MTMQRLKDFYWWCLKPVILFHYWMTHEAKAWIDQKYEEAQREYEEAKAKQRRKK